MGDGSRSLFCRFFSSVVSNNSEGAGSLDSRTEVADVDGVDCWGSAKIRETLICAGSCFEAARHVCLEFLFGGGVVIKVQVCHFTCVVNLGLDQIREVAPWGHGHKSRKSRESLCVGCLPYLWVKGCIDLTCPPSLLRASILYLLIILIHWYSIALGGLSD